ncbi:SWIM zinc finger family protein [Candidatus Dependentiae bacterium]|nr:SWIM zinc finger family protein [Candidatus Dependentiae bacterium]
MTKITYADGKKLTTKPQHEKAESFVKNKCVSAHKSALHMFKMNEPDHFTCKPIKGYNVTTYNIRERLNGTFDCTCQFNTTTHKMCSHILAVLLFKERRGIT